MKIPIAKRAVKQSAFLIALSFFVQNNVMPLTYQMRGKLYVSNIIEILAYRKQIGISGV
jgi:hypothetical protein